MAYGYDTTAVDVISAEEGNVYIVSFYSVRNFAIKLYMEISR